MPWNLLKGDWTHFDGYFRTSRCTIPRPEKANSLYVENIVKTAAVEFFSFRASNRAVKLKKHLNSQLIKGVRDIVYRKLSDKYLTILNNY
jgi:hypothetical protein